MTLQIITQRLTLTAVPLQVARAAGGGKRQLETLIGAHVDDNWLDEDGRGLLSYYDYQLREDPTMIGWVRENLPVEAALTNSVVLDPTKDFFPFGQHPAFGDTLYVACAEALSKAGAAVTMHIVLTNPESGGHQALEFEVDLLQLKKCGCDLCRAHRQAISFRAYDMVLDGVMFESYCTPLLS